MLFRHERQYFRESFVSYVETYSFIFFLTTFNNFGYIFREVLIVINFGDEHANVRNIIKKIIQFSMLSQKMWDEDKKKMFGRSSLVGISMSKCMHNNIISIQIFSQIRVLEHISHMKYVYCLCESKMQ